MKTINPNGLVLPVDYPFNSDVERMIAKSKIVNRTVNVREGLATEKITVTMERTYLPIGFAKLYKNKEILGDLSPNACKILIYISLNIGYEEVLIKLSATIVGIDKRAFSKAMVELMLARVVVFQKKCHYWVNVTIIVVGRLNEKQLTE